MTLELRTKVRPHQKAQPQTLIFQEHGFRNAKNRYPRGYSHGLAAMALGFWPVTATAQDAQPTLAETLAWMDSTFNPHRSLSEGGSFGYGV
jgi:hypothetical protein